MIECVKPNSQFDRSMGLMTPQHNITPKDETIFGKIACMAKEGTGPSFCSTSVMSDSRLWLIWRLNHAEDMGGGGL